jgi:hypothetical protein
MERLRTMDLWNTPEIQKAVEESKARREWIADNLELYDKSQPQWKYSAMEIRADLIMTREKLATLYLVTGKEEVLSIMGELFRAIERIKAL